MPLDEMDSREFKKFAVTLQTGDWDDTPPELEWDESETASITSEFIGRLDNED